MRAGRRVASPPLEAFGSLGTPVVLDQNDAGQVYTLGLQFTVSKAGLWLAVDWFAPSTCPALAYTVGAYVNANPVPLASKAFTPIPGRYNRVFFDTPVAVAPGDTSTAAVLTQHYAFTAGYTLPVTTPHMTIPAGQGWFNAGAALTLPVGGPTGNFYFVTPVARF